MYIFLFTTAYVEKISFRIRCMLVYGIHIPAVMILAPLVTPPMEVGKETALAPG